MHCRRRLVTLLGAVLVLGVLLTLVYPVAGDPADRRYVYLPLFPEHSSETKATATPTLITTPTVTVTLTVTVTPVPVQVWDPRLDLRGAVLVEAAVTPGQGYWRLVRARWYNVDESQGRHHIFMDILTQEGARQTEVPLVVSWSSGASTVRTEGKPGEAYAANVAMYALAPAYSARPDDGAPADRIDGMGLGEIDDPVHAHHTSYGLVWQWTIADGPSTPTPTPTVVPSGTLTDTVTPTPTPAPTHTGTSTATPAPRTAPTLTPTPTPTPTATLVFDRAALVECVPDNRSTRVEGMVYRNNLPADGYAVVFSWQPDGVWSANPTVSGPNPPGAYTHFIGVAVGDWWVWIVDAQGRRISPMGSFSTDGPGGTCNVATVDFYGP